MVTKSKAKKATPKRKVMAKKPLARKTGATLSSNGKRALVPFQPTKLKLLQPVPSDIEIAQAAKVKPILQVAAELGIRENELELFGPYKAKVKLEILDRLIAAGSQSPPSPHWIQTRNSVGSAGLLPQAESNKLKTITTPSKLNIFFIFISPFSLD